MATRDFRSQQIRISQLIASGTNQLKTPSLLIYSASAATNDQGGYISSMLDGGGAGTDPSGHESAWLFISGSRVGSDKAQVLFGGNIIVSGSVSGSVFASRRGEDMTVASDGNISFVIDKDANESSQYFEWMNSTTQIAKLEETGNLQLDGDLTVGGGDLTITAGDDGHASVLLQADRSDDAGDDWTVTANANQTFTIGNDIASAGTAVSHLTITPHATVTNSTVNAAGNLEIGNTLTVPGDIVHTGDDDTKINFDDNEVKVVAGGTHITRSSSTKHTINKDYANVDFEVRGDTNNKRIIHVDASADTVKFLDDNTTAIDDLGGGAGRGNRDVNFFVKGVPGAHQNYVENPTSATGRGVALFTGDLVVSGTLYAEKQVMDVDMLVNSGSNLILSQSLHMKNVGAGTGASITVPALDGAIYVATGSLFAKLANGAGVTTEVKVGANYQGGNGIGTQVDGTNTIFHVDINSLTGSLAAADVQATDLIGVADISEATNETKKITFQNFATNLSGDGDLGLFTHTSGTNSTLKTNDGKVAHLTGSVFSGRVGVTGSNNVSITTINRVGVGVQDPDSMLEVYSGTEPQVKISYDADTSATIGVDAGGQLTLSAVDNDADIVFKVDDAGSDITAVRIDGGDKGSTKFTPASGGSIQVQPASDDGVTTIGGAETSIVKATNTPGVSPVLSLKKSRGDLAGKTALANDDTIGTITFYGYDTDYSTSAAITAKADGAHSGGGTDAPGKLIFATTPNASETLTDRMTIFSDGKLGMNTTAPQNHHVFASGSTEIFGGDLIINRDDGGNLDPILQFQLDSGITATWSVGIDDSDSDKFKINNAAGFADPSKFELDSSGNTKIAGDLTVSGNNIKGAGGSAGITFDGSGNTAVDGNLKITGNIIQASDGGSTITMDTSDNVTIGGDLTVTGNNIAGNAGTNLTLDSGGDVSVTGDLTVTGNNIKDAGGTHGITFDGSGNTAIDGMLKVTGNFISGSNGHAISLGSGGDVTVVGDLQVGGNDIKDSGGSAAITMDGSSNVAIGGTLTVPSDIIHSGDDNTKIQFDVDIINLQAAGETLLKLRKDGNLGEGVQIGAPGSGISTTILGGTAVHAFKSHSIIMPASTRQVLILSGGHSSSTNEAAAADVGFYVSGSIDSAGKATRGTSVFGGDVVVSGSLLDANGNNLAKSSVAENLSSTYNPTAGGSNAVAIGRNAVASGANSIAMGSSTTNQTDATAQHATAIGGDDATASGDYSAVLGGYQNTASGNYSVAVGGSTNTVGGQYSVVAGNASSVTGHNSVGMGQSITVGGSNSIALGKSLTANENDTISLGNNTSDAKIALSGSVEVFSDLIIPENIMHAGDLTTKAQFETARIKFTTAGTQLLNLRKDGVSGEEGVFIGSPGSGIPTVIHGGAAGASHAIIMHNTTNQVLIMSGGNSASPNEAGGLDVNFYVSGSIGSLGTATRGAAVFGGDLHISGALSGPNEYALIDNSVRMFRDGDTLKFDDGQNTPKTLSQLASVGASTDHFVGTHGGTPQTSKLKATGSVAFAGADDNFVDGLLAKDVGKDVFVYFSGSIGARAGHAAAGANQFKTDGRAVTLFGGDSVFSGSATYLSTVGFTDVDAAGSIIAGGGLLKNSNGDTNIKFDAANPRVLFGDASVISQNPQSNVHIAKADNTQASAANEYSHFGLSLRNDSTQTNAFAGIAFDVSTEVDADSIGAAIRAERDTSASTTAANHATNLTFATNPNTGDAALTERMRITHDGKVGIGVDPSYRLDVDGDIRLRGNDIRDNSGAVFISGDGSANAIVANDLTISGGDLIFSNAQNATIDVADVSGTDTVGKSLTLLAGASTGNAAGGNIDFKVTQAGGSSNASVNSHVTILSLNPSTGISTFAGPISLPNNDGIKNGDGENVIIVDADQNVEIEGDLRVKGNDIKDSGDNIAITMDGSSNVSIVGDLTVSGGDLKFSNAANATIDVNDTANTAAGKNLTISAGSTASGGTNNLAGGNLILQAGLGKGSAFGGDIDFKSSAGGGNGNSMNSATTLMSISPTAGQIQMFEHVEVSSSKDLRFGGVNNKIEIDTNLKITTQNDLEITSNLQVNGASIKSSDGNQALVLSGSGNVAIPGNLQVSGDDILDSKGNTVISFDGAGNVDIVGTVTQSTTQFGQTITVGTDADGADRSIIFGHSTLKSRIGIYDDQDVFAINTDQNFEASNDFEIAASGDVTIGNGNLIIDGGDLVVAGNDISGSVGLNMSLGSSGLVTFAGDIRIPEDLVHDGDTDTKFRFFDDKISLEAGGFPMALFDAVSAQKAVVFNEASGDHDFRIEGDGDTHAFFLEASSDFIGVGTSSPATKLHVKGDFTVQDGASSDVIGKLYASNDDGVLDLYQSNAVTTRLQGNGDSYFGMKLGIGGATPENSLTVRISAGDGDDGILVVRVDGSTNNNDLLGAIGFDSTDGNVPSSIIEASAFIAGYASQAHSTVDKGGYLVFGTAADDTSDDTITPERMRLTDTGDLGIGVTDPDHRLEVMSTSNQFKISYSDSVSSAMTLSDEGDFQQTVPNKYTLDAEGTITLKAGTSSSQIVISGSSDSDIVSILAGVDAANTRRSPVMAIVESPTYGAAPVFMNSNHANHVHDINQIYNNCDVTAHGSPFIGNTLSQRYHPANFCGSTIFRESSVRYPPSITFQNTANTTHWTVTNGTHSATPDVMTDYSKVTILNGGNANDGRFLTTDYKLPGGVPVEIHFYLSIHSNSPEDGDDLFLQVSEDGASWTTVATYDESGYDTPADSDGVEVNFDLNASLVPGGDYYVRFAQLVHAQDPYDGWEISAVDICANDNAIGTSDSIIEIEASRLKSDQMDNNANLMAFTDAKGTSAGSISISKTVPATVIYSTFTGGHSWRLNNEASFENFMIGKIVSTEGPTEEPIYVCEPTTAAKDKSVIGVLIEDSMLGHDGKSEYEMIRSLPALGNFKMLVCSEGGDIGIGDYICSSNVKGAGMKQDTDAMMNYTFAKASESVDWSLESGDTKVISCILLSG